MSGVSAMIGKQRYSSREDFEWSTLVGLGILTSSRPHLKASSWARGSVLELGNGLG